MSDKIQRIKSISQFHEVMGFDKPSHPLISIIDVSKWAYGEEWIGVKSTSDLYSIALKDKSCGLEYGRNTYDFDEGVMIFTAPNQVISTTKAQQLNEIQGWMLFFHPDLIRNMTLGQKIDEYKFFAYDVHEALHLSNEEQNIITECVNMIQSEIKERIDNHSQRVITSTLELLLNYALRYYERQFNTRSAQNSDVVSNFETSLKTYYSAGSFSELGIPSIQYFANKVHLSKHYFSDLIKKETGRSPKDHINDFVIEKAKNTLLNSESSISEIAYDLGFNYPHYFTRLFKNKTGQTPAEYRKLN